MLYIETLAAMLGQSSDRTMDSRDNFKQTIFDHYKKVSIDQIPMTLLNSLCDKVADYYYDQYTRFREQYPKSKKGIRHFS